MIVLYAVVGVQLKEFFDYGILHQQQNLIADAINCGFLYSELIVGDSGSLWGLTVSGCWCSSL
jgi:hypothetical protein